VIVDGTESKCARSVKGKDVPFCKQCEDRHVGSRDEPYTFAQFPESKVLVKA
jgi:hypothetical protein